MSNSMLTDNTIWERLHVMNHS